jgi:hypothetical protein
MSGRCRNARRPVLLAAPASRRSNANAAPSEASSASATGASAGAPPAAIVAIDGGALAGGNGSTEAAAGGLGGKLGGFNVLLVPVALVAAAGVALVVRKIMNREQEGESC